MQDHSAVCSASQAACTFKVIDLSWLDGVVYLLEKHRVRKKPGSLDVRWILI